MTEMKSEKMLFVVGSSRSGTTMLGRALDAHSQVHTFPELQVFERVIDIEEMGEAPVDKGRLEHIGCGILDTIRHGVFEASDPDSFLPEIREFIESHKIETPMGLYQALLTAEARAANKTISCEQTPRYMFVSEQILSAFPDAHVIHIYRDPRDVLLSQKNRWRRRFLTNAKIPLKRTLVAWSNYHPELTSRLWGATMREADRLSAHPRFFEVRYETLLEHPETTLQELCSSVGLPFEAEMLGVRQEGSSMRRDVAGTTGFDASRIGSWRKGGLSAAEIAVCEARLGPIMEKRGYARSPAKSGVFGRALIWAILPAKVLAGIAMNARRFRNLRKTVLRRL